MKLENSIEKVIKKLFSKRTRNLENIREIDYNTLKQIVKQNANIVLVDVRSPQEHQEKRIPSSINIPLYELEILADSILQDKNQTIIIYCQSGVRSSKAYKILKEKGYKNLYNLKGGIDNI